MPFYEVGWGAQKWVNRWCGVRRVYVLGVVLSSLGSRIWVGVDHERQEGLLRTSLFRLAKSRPEART